MEVTFNTNDVMVYVAGAGSGKTTVLMSELSDMLRTYRPDEIAFTTFTRRGVSTGVDRTLTYNPLLDQEDLPYFQTLHRMCFRELGLSYENMLEQRDLLRFNRLLGFKLGATAAFDCQTEDDRLIQRYDAIRGGAKSGYYMATNFDEERYNRLIHAYEKFKAENDLVDFYDCLLMYKERGKPLPVSAFLLDEAQDVTVLQWEVIQLAAKNAKHIRISGDPAQAIFAYQGASPDILLHLAEKHQMIPLNKTYRLPKKICVVADGIIDLMQQKIPRKHIPAKVEDGTVQELASRELLIRLVRKDFEANNKATNRWFMLFRCNHHIAGITKMLEQHLIPYHTPKGFVLAERELNKIQRYLKFREVGYSTPEARARFAAEHRIVNFEDSWVKSNILPTEQAMLYEDYIDKFGIDALVSMAKAEPFCMVSTTYKVKGGEADNVAVFLDSTKQVSESITMDLDGELRVFYVACTRAREKLYVVKAETTHSLTSLWESTVEVIGHTL